MSDHEGSVTNRRVNPELLNLFTLCLVVSFFLPNPSAKAIRTKFATPFPTPCSTPAWQQDKKSRVACETYAKSNIVVVGGEITDASAKLDYVHRSCAMPFARSVT